MRKIEFGEVRISPESKKHIEDCINSNWITMGPKTKLLEEKFGAQLGYKHVVALNSGTSADIAACAALYDFGAKEGDEIICPALGFIAYANAIRTCGFKPVFVDIKRTTLNIDEELIESVITPRTRAILAVNTMGKPCKADIIRDVCNKYELMYISDSCESHLCKYQGKYMGEYADMCTYSAYIAHLIISCEQGYIGTNRDDLPPILRSIRSHGRPDNSLYFQHDRFGLNLKPTDLHSCIGLGNVDVVHDTFKKRKDNWYYLNQTKLRDICFLSEEDEGDTNCPHGFSLTVKNPDNFQMMVDTLDEYLIHHKRNFGCIPTQHGAFKHMGIPEGYLVESEYVGNNGVHIGCHQYLTQEDLGQIMECFDKIYERAI